jgi:hypothetical protein
MLSSALGIARSVHTSTMIFVLLLLSEQAASNPQTNISFHDLYRMAI